MNPTIYQLKLYYKRILRYIYSFKYIFNQKQIETEILNSIPSKQNDISTFLDMLDRYLHSVLTYQSDTIDFSKHPIQTWIDKGGDCDDWAAIMLMIVRLQYPDLDSHLFLVFNDKEGHAICVVKDKNGNLHNISNWGYLGATDTFDNLASTVFQDWKSWWKLSYNLSIIDYKQR